MVGLVRADAEDSIEDEGRQDADVVDHVDA